MNCTCALVCVTPGKIGNISTLDIRIDCNENARKFWEKGSIKDYDKCCFPTGK